MFRWFICPRMSASRRNLFPFSDSLICWYSFIATTLPLYSALYTFEKCPFIRKDIYQPHDLFSKLSKLIPYNNFPYKSQIVFWYMIFSELINSFQVCHTHKEKKIITVPIFSFLVISLSFTTQFFSTKKRFKELCHRSFADSSHNRPTKDCIVGKECPCVHLSLSHFKIK